MANSKKQGVFFGSMVRYSLFLVATAALLASCNNKKGANGAAQGKLPPATVTVYTVTPASYQINESFPATLEANTIVELRPDVTGYLEAIRVRDGSYVRRGQILYEIDKSRYQAAYNQAQATLQQMQATLAQNKQDLKRYEDLLSHDAIAKQVVDQAKTTVKTAQANVAAAKAAVDKAATDLNHALVRSPMNGKIGIVQAKVGDIINAGQTVLNTIVNDNPMYADFNILQSQVHEFSGKSLAGKQFYLKLADSSRYPYPGKLLVINNVVDPATGTIRIRLEFPNKDGVLKSGMNGVILVEQPSDSNALAIPTKSIIQILSENSVYVVDPQNVVTSKQIVPGPQLDSLTIVENGISPGDRVIVDGLQQVHPGDTVNVANQK